METIREILKQICDNKTIQDLLKSENLIDAEDPDVLKFKDANSELALKITDNGLSLSYVSEPDTTREDFTRFCDTLDDDFFQQVCDSYTKAYGDKSLNALNKNLTLENIRGFYNHVAKVIDKNMATLNKYRDALAIACSKL